MAPLTNAERQARFRERIRDKANSGVTAEDVRRAVRICYEAFCADVGQEADFEGWLAQVRKRKGTGTAWREFLPHSANPAEYWDHLSADDRAFLAKVGAVSLAVLEPPKD